MRENGVRSLSIQYHQCRHEIVMNVDHLPGELTCRRSGGMVCTKCGSSAPMSGRIAGART